MEGNQEVNEEEYLDEEGLEGIGEGLEDYGEGMDLSSSEPKPLGGIHALFKEVLNKPCSTKVSNLNSIELGDLGISVRECMRISLFAETFGHEEFANFFRKQAGIVSDSSMSKDGWFTNLFVTSKTYASRSSSSNIKSLPQFNKTKWKMFSAKKKEQQ